MKIWQLGMTLIPGVMLALFHFRKETTERLIAAGKIAPGGVLPWDIYLIGTFFVFVICIALCSMLEFVVRPRYLHYAELLTKECENVLPLPVPTKWGRWLFYLTFGAFPLVDFILFLFYQWRVQIDFVVR